RGEHHPLSLHDALPILKAKQKEWQTSAAAVPYAQQVQQAATVPRAQLDQIRSVDPDFSIVLFEDFVYTLYAEMQRARAGNTASRSEEHTSELQSLAYLV